MEGHSKKPTDWLHWVQALEAIAQTGLVYAKDPYDKERYQAIMDLVAQQYASATGVDLTQVVAALSNEVGYPTPKLSVRAFISWQDRVLLVEECNDSKWALPGGWADMNASPCECVVKEVWEETGYKAEVVRLMALWDKQKHDHPPHWPHGYQLIFECRLLGGDLRTSHEISDVGFFAMDALPTLCTHRVTRRQLQRLFEMQRNGAVVECD